MNACTETRAGHPCGEPADKRCPAHGPRCRIHRSDEGLACWTCGAALEPIA